MRSLRTFVLAFLSLLAFPSLPQQVATTVQRDPQAVSLLQSSIKALGGTVPTDSVASGNVTIVAGSQTSTGTIRILTRGTNQSSEQITLPQSTITVTFSGGLADQTINSTTSSLALERAATSQSVLFPLPFLAAALANSDMSIQYIGLETLNQSSVQHLRLQNSFASWPTLQQFADFAVFDVWLDATTGLPQEVSFVRRDGWGAVPRIPVDVYFSNFKAISGTAYPMQISLSLNGTPWTTIAISTVTFNTGLTDSNFSVQ